MLLPTAAAPIDLNLSVEKMEKVAFILKPTAHPTRIAIVQLLAAQGSLSVGELSEKFSVEQSCCRTTSRA